MKYMIMIVAGMLALNSAFGENAERVKTGFGASVTASTAPTNIVIEQYENDNVVSNGTFASTADWTTNVQWTITGGYAVFASSNSILNGDFASTNAWMTNGPLWAIAGGTCSFLATNIPGTQTMYQALTTVPATSGQVYRINYTVSGIDGPCYIYPEMGPTLTATGTVRGTNGVYTETLTVLQGCTNLSFTGYSTTEPATGIIDNVSIRLNGLVQTNELSQEITNIVVGQKYRITYTIASIDPTTNSVYVRIGNNVSPQRTANGTYSDDVYASDSSNLAFRVVDTNTSSLTIDDVIVRVAPDAAWANTVDLSVGPTDVPVYLQYNCSGNVFSNQYAAGRTIIVSSNAAVTLDQGSDRNPFRWFWYRSASGSPTLRITAH